MTRAKLLHVLAIAFLLGGPPRATIAAPTPTAARGTIEYAKRHALYAPRPNIPPSARHFSGTGVFAMHLRPDGTVSDVKTLQSTGHAELDAASIAAFSNWRFYPGQFKLVRIPITYVGRR